MNMISRQHNRNCMVAAPGGGSSGALVRTLVAMLMDGSENMHNRNGIATKQAGIDAAWAPLSDKKSAALSCLTRSGQSVAINSFAEQSTVEKIST